jgi:ParB/RepB/Spo0J family partition protein
MEIAWKPLDWYIIPSQARTNLGDEKDLWHLYESLRVRQLCPVIAQRKGDRGLLVAGFRRFAAATLGKLPQLEVKIYDEELTASDLKIINLTENIHRLDLSPYEKWQAIEELRRLHPKLLAKDLAEMLHLDPSHITRLLSPGKCIPAIQEALKARQFGISDCYAASKVSEQQQHEFLRMKREDGANRETLEKAVRKARPKTPDPISSSTITIPINGVKVTLKGKRMNLVQVVECLSECVDAAKKGIKERLTVKSWQSVLRDKSREVAGV